MQNANQGVEERHYCRILALQGFGIECWKINVSITAQRISRGASVARAGSLHYIFHFVVIVYTEAIHTYLGLVAEKHQGLGHL